MNLIPKLLENVCDQLYELNESKNEYKEGRISYAQFSAVAKKMIPEFDYVNRQNAVAFVDDWIFDNVERCKKFTKIFGKYAVSKKYRSKPEQVQQVNRRGASTLVAPSIVGGTGGALIQLASNVGGLSDVLTSGFANFSPYFGSAFGSPWGTGNIAGPGFGRGVYLLFGGAPKKRKQSVSQSKKSRKSGTTRRGRNGITRRVRGGGGGSGALLQLSTTRRNPYVRYGGCACDADISSPNRTGLLFGGKKRTRKTF